MRNAHWHRQQMRVFFGGLMILLNSGNAFLLEAQQKHLSVDGPAVDIVTLKSGRTLRGVVMSQSPNGSLTLLVSRDWLTTANPMLAATVLKENLDGCRVATSQAHDRIADLLKTPIESPHLTFFFKQELERFKATLKNRNEEEPEFLWVDVRHETIAKVKSASAEQRRITAFAWSERLAHVETRESSPLKTELTGRGVDLDGAFPEALLKRLPARKQTDEEWNARLAVVEYSLAQPVDFQGLGDTLARVGKDQAASLGELLPQLLQQQLGSFLKDLTNECPPLGKVKNDKPWMTRAISITEQEKAKGFRATSLELDAGAARVTVETCFVARVAAGKWKTIWKAQERCDGTKARPQMEATIEQDPQVKSVFSTMKSFGLSDPETLKHAIRVGAATMTAQQAADLTFAKFRDQYSRHLDGPPLMIPGSP